MPGRIQSVERATAALTLLGAAGDLSLAEIADALGLPRPTVHGILATLAHVGFVEQDADTRRYRLGPGLTGLGHLGVDRHDLRSVATSWCDTLAARTRTEVLVAVPSQPAGVAEIVHHVFRPDGSPQHLRTGEQVPAHATGLGKVLLSAVPGAHRAGLDLDRYTRRTITSVTALAGVLGEVRHRGWATGVGEWRPEIGDVAAPVRISGGLVIGALGCSGPLPQLFATDGRPRVDVVAAVTATATAVGRALEAPR